MGHLDHGVPGAQGPQDALFHHPGDSPCPASCSWKPSFHVRTTDTPGLTRCASQGHSDTLDPLQVTPLEQESEAALALPARP